MAQPSYYLLSPLKAPLEGSSSPYLGQHFEGGPNPPNLAGSAGSGDPPGSRSSPFLPLLRPRLFRKGRPPSWRVISPSLEMALLPLVAIGYLAFCYTAHGRVVPVNTYGLYAVTPRHFAAIKGGITSISIIIISIALFPVYDVVSNLKGEEFFRSLASHSDGVPLGTINSISNPSFGNIDTLSVMWKHTCSNYYFLAITASLLVWIVTTLAPGALTINTVLTDGELMAFAIGAVPVQSVLNGTNPQEPASTASLNADPAASIAWAEIELDVQYSFSVADTSEPEYAAYLVPIPLDLSTTTSARWLSDVIGLNPVCSWASTNLTAPVKVPVNSTSSIGQYFATAYLIDYNLDVEVTGGDIPAPVGGSPFTLVKDPTQSITNHTTHALASDGSTVFLIGQCQSGCLPGTLVDVKLDLTSINTTFTIALTDETWTMAFLVCNPNITIESREVRNDGHGVLTVQPLPAGRQLKPQGNLNPIQTTALFSIATKSISRNGGALTGNQVLYYQLGSQVQGDLMFGKAQFASLPGTNAPDGTSVTLTLASIKDITNGYTQILRSVSKSYLAGYLGTAYVPGRISTSEIVFATSIPNLAISSAVFALLIALIVLAHFRPGKGVGFTLVNVATAVHGSELPAQFVQTRTEQMAGVGVLANVEVEGDPETDGALANSKGAHLGTNVSGDHQDVAEILSERRVYMKRRTDGSPVLHLG